MALAALSAAGLCFNLFYLVLVAVGETKHRIPGLLPAFALSGHTILLLAFVIHPMIGYRRVFETHWMCQSQGAVIVFGAFVTAAYVLTLVFSLYNTVVRRADWMPSERLLHRTIFSATAVYAAALGLFGVFEDAALCCFFNPGHAYTFLFFSGPLLVVTLVGGYAWISVLQAMAKIQLSQQGATESSALIAQNGHEKPHTIRVLIRAATKHPRHVAMLAVIVFSVLTAAGCELAIALGSQNTPVYSVYICAIVAPVQLYFFLSFLFFFFSFFSFGFRRSSCRRCCLPQIKLCSMFLRDSLSVGANNKNRNHGFGQGAQCSLR
eukprot:TRINITY_DN2445_c0_g1_i2.p1 TRINITY_DN2445_c0_g1~~TRINITY_DN2445_c0_g1_i2.p1  ORF type:complete len:322 (-),score=50.29 TRINITY_DN2445_c0_g1_i2:93-1058(-)